LSLKEKGAEPITVFALFLFHIDYDAAGERPAINGGMGLGWPLQHEDSFS
jgi:hypothetical protein